MKPALGASCASVILTSCSSWGSQRGVSPPSSAGEFLSLRPYCSLSPTVQGLLAVPVGPPGTVAPAEHRAWGAWLLPQTTLGPLSL